MTDIEHCKGCSEDFYNGHNPYGVKECWNRKDATMVPRILIHIHQPPPYLDVETEMRPSCYRMNGFVAVSPNRIRPDGYWTS